jgi:hypothetical protein
MTKRKKPEPGTYMHIYITPTKKAQLTQLAEHFPTKQRTLSAAVRYLIDWALEQYGNEKKNKG